MLQVGIVAVSQLVDARHGGMACHPGGCRRAVPAHLTARAESILSDPAMISSCSSPRSVHDITMTACAEELLNDASLGCTCTNHCMQAIGKVLPQP